MNHYVSNPDDTIRKIISQTFPGYRGRSIKLSTDIPSRLDSYWDGGSRDSYCFYSLDENKSLSVHSNHPYFESGQPSVLKRLPDRIVLVKHCIFCGKDLGITIYANESDLTPMLPKAADSELSRDEQIVLIATRSLKNSYGGRSDIRFEESRYHTRIDRERWFIASDSLKAKGYLKSNGAITPEGRNALSQAGLERKDLWHYRQA